MVNGEAVIQRLESGDQDGQTCFGGQTEGRDSEWHAVLQRIYGEGLGGDKVKMDDEAEEPPFAPGEWGCGSGY